MDSGGYGFYSDDDIGCIPVMADVKISSNGNHGFFNGNDNHGFFVVNDNDDFFDNGVANESETGDVNLSFGVSQTGNNSNQCVTPLQFGNTGSNQNAQEFSSFGSSVDDVEFEGGDFTFAPVLNASCNQAVQQSSAPSSWWW